MVPEEKPGKECDEEGIYAAFDMVRTFPIDDDTPDFTTRREQHARNTLTIYEQMTKKYGYRSAFSALATGLLEAAAQCAEALARHQNTTREELFKKTLAEHYFPQQVTVCSHRRDGVLDTDPQSSTRPDAAPNTAPGYTTPNTAATVLKQSVNHR